MQSKLCPHRMVQNVLILAVSLTGETAVRQMLTDIPSWGWGLGEDQLRSNLEKNTCGPAAKVNTTQEDPPYLLLRASVTASPTWKVEVHHSTPGGDKDLRLGDSRNRS